MTTKQDEPDIPDVIGDVINSKVAEIRTVIPGRIVSYDHDEQRCSVRPVVQSSRKDPDTGEPEPYTPATIQNCPVQFPASEAFSMTFPLEKGDRVKISFASRSLDEWLTQGGDTVTPADLRRHDISDAIVEPGLRAFAEALGSDRIDDSSLVIFGESIYLGDANPAQFIALAGKVESELNSIKNTVNALVSAYNLHTHQIQVASSAQPSPQDNVTLTNVPTAAQASPAVAVGSVASDKVKAD